MLDQYLDDLEDRIDPDEEERLASEWRSFATGRRASGIFHPAGRAARPTGLEWPAIRINAAIDEPEAMLLRQFGQCSAALAVGSAGLLAVRADYGTSILPSLFGAELFMMADELDTLPTNRPMGGSDAARKILDQGMPPLDAGLGGKVLALGARYREIADAYPRIGAHVHVYHPDTQGALDVCELIWGSSIFMAFYEEPDLLTDLLNLVTDTYIAFLRQWFEIFPPEGDAAVHWGIMHGGTIMIRDDSAMNISAEHYEAFGKPYDARCIEAFGGGGIHFCGKGDHYIETMSAIPGLRAINLSQPELNDMETIYANTIDRDIQLVGLARWAAEEAEASGRDLRGNVHAA